MKPREMKPREMLALVAVSLVLIAIRLWAASVVGFGDSEALYASWALHPQPAYLDHPGLVGVIARAIGEGAAPTPQRAHVITALVATVVPWLVYAAARALGAERRPSFVAAIIVALVPEISIGLFALTPDLVLAPAWLGALALAGVGLRAKPGTAIAATSFLGAGLLAGIGASAKVSGLLLVLALAVAYGTIARTKHDEARAVRTVWPWAGLFAGFIVVLPVFLFEAQSGFPMLRHRLVDTQQSASLGRVIGNAGSLVGGQLLYLSPLLAWIAIHLSRNLFRARREDAASILLFTCFAVPLLPLIILCLWSPVAEPHWIAPALLALPVHAARRPESVTGVREAKLVRWGAAVAALLTLVVHGWILVPASARILPDDADPKIDIANELYGWPSVLEGVRKEMRNAATPYDPEGREVAVVGPHWVICGQLHAAMPGVRVGCATPIPDDFDRWLPRDEWRNASDVLWVTDNRFHGDGAEQLPRHVRSYEARVRIQRGGRTVRVFTLILYSKQASSQRAPSHPTPAPEARALPRAPADRDETRGRGDPRTRDPRRRGRHDARTLRATHRTRRTPPLAGGAATSITAIVRPGTRARQPRPRALASSPLRLFASSPLRLFALALLARRGLRGGESSERCGAGDGAGLSPESSAADAPRILITAIAHRAGFIAGDGAARGGGRR